MEPVTIIAIGTSIIAVGSFIGSSLSNYLFSPSSETGKKATNEIKADIKVMATEIKSISLLEVVIVVMVTVVLIACAIGVCYCVYKKCRKNNNKSDVISLSRIPAAARSGQYIQNV